MELGELYVHIYSHGAQTYLYKIIVHAWRNDV